MGSVQRDGGGALVGGHVLLWLLLGQVGSVVLGSLWHLRPANVCAAVGAGLRGALDSIVSLFNPQQRRLHHWLRDEVPFREVPGVGAVWADGAILCVIVENAIAPNAQPPHHHHDKYRACATALPSIRLGQKLAQQYLNVPPEFTPEEMGKEADPEIILRLVKYLQSVKRASKAIKLKKPEDNERRLTLKERLDEVQKAHQQLQLQPKPEALRKKRIVHRKRRLSKTPDLKAGLNLSPYSSTSNDLDDATRAKSEAVLQEELTSKCHEIQSMCELLLVRGSQRRSLQIFNTAARILTSRNSTLDDPERLRLLTQSQDEPHPEETEVLKPTQVESQPESEVTSPPVEVVQLPDVAALSIDDHRRASVDTEQQPSDTDSGVFFARRLSGHALFDENQVDNPLFQQDKQQCDSHSSNHQDDNSTAAYKAYKGVKARRRFFQEAAAAAAMGQQRSISVEDRPAPPPVDNKKRYEEVRNFFKNMEQQRRPAPSKFATGRRSSDTPPVPEPELRQAPVIRYMSCRVRGPRASADSREPFEEPRQAVRTMQKPDVSAVMASLNSAYEEQRGGAQSPYDSVRDADDDSEDSEGGGGGLRPQQPQPDLLQRRVSFSQLQREGDAAIF